jgi:soluble lytic murein transglycosylase-like protein
VYKYRDAEGRIYLTDKPMKGGYRLLKRFSLKGTRASRPADSLAKMRQRRANLAPLIEEAARRSRLPDELVHAVVRVESAYRTDAISSKGAMGLMQLMPATAQRFGVSNAYDARQNLDGGTRYLRLLLEQFNQDLRLALAAYNAGENAVSRYGNKIPPFPETRDYVKKVITFYNQNQAGDKLAQR